MLGSDYKDKKIIKEELNRRIDEKGNLFLRFDKQLAYDEKLKLTYSGDAIHVRIKIASYPVSQENAVKVAEVIEAAGHCDIADLKIGISKLSLDFFKF